MADDQPVATAAPNNGWMDLAEVTSIDRALDRLMSFDPVMSRALRLRFFDGLSMSETAQIVGLPQRLFELSFYVARNWVKADLTGNNAEAERWRKSALRRPGGSTPRNAPPASPP